MTNAKQQEIKVRQIKEAGAVESFAAADNGTGAQISAIVAELAGLLSDVNSPACRSELTGLDLGQRLTVCKKWLSMVYVLRAAETKNRVSQDMPGGRAAFSFYKRIEDARACGWTIQDSRSYTAKVDFAYWGKADVDESGQAFDDAYVPFESVG